MPFAFDFHFHGLLSPTDNEYPLCLTRNEYTQFADFLWQWHSLKFWATYKLFTVNPPVCHVSKRETVSDIVDAILCILAAFIAYKTKLKCVILLFLMRISLQICNFVNILQSQSSFFRFTDLPEDIPF